LTTDPNVAFRGGDDTAVAPPSNPKDCDSFPVGGGGGGDQGDYCNGSCRWRWGGPGIRWVKVSDECKSGGNVTFCACQPPSKEPCEDDCGQDVSTPCKTKSNIVDLDDCGNPKTTPRPGAACAGACVYKWNDGLDDWELVSSSCEGCLCGDPPVCPGEECEYGSGPCTDPNTITTTTSTSTTTTTTTTTPCLPNRCFLIFGKDSVDGGYYESSVAPREGDPPCDDPCYCAGRIPVGCPNGCLPGEYIYLASTCGGSITPTTPPIMRRCFHFQKVCNLNPDGTFGPGTTLANVWYCGTSTDAASAANCPAGCFCNNDPSQDYGDYTTEDCDGNCAGGPSGTTTTSTTTTTTTTCEMPCGLSGGWYVLRYPGPDGGADTHMSAGAAYYDPTLGCPDLGGGESPCKCITAGPFANPFEIVTSCDDPCICCCAEQMGVASDPEGGIYDCSDYASQEPSPKCSGGIS
jgi:hypothetical protein